MELGLMVFIFISTLFAGSIWYLYTMINKNIEDTEHLPEDTRRTINNVENLEDVVDALKRRIEEINVRNERFSNSLRVIEENITKMSAIKCSPPKQCPSKKKKKKSPTNSITGPSNHAKEIVKRI